MSAKFSSLVIASMLIGCQGRSTIQSVPLAADSGLERVTVLAKGLE